MRHYISAALAFLFALLATPVTHAVENTWDYSVQVSSSVQVSPAKIVLAWPQDTTGIPQSYTVYRKTPESASWGSGTTLPGTATEYTDTNVAVGSAYEYRIVKVAATYTGYGYIHTGISAPLLDARGKIVLIVDNTFSSTLASELTRLESDLAGDGWTVVRRDASPTDSVPSIKALIKAAYDADPANVKSVFLFGHVPVPYSGQLNPDGHPDHVGAWPADAYYGDMDGNWTDSVVNYTQTLNTDPVDAARMSNYPGDGKFDQTTLPSVVELAVGRVDLSKMPGRVTWGGPATFPSEADLLRKYLNKDHAFRHHLTSPARRAILGDYFGVRGGEAFAASGFRSFAPLVGATNIRNLNTEFNDQKGVWIPQSAQNDYLLAYACGAGSYATMGGLGSTGIYNDGSTTEMVANNVRGVFNLLFGSWLGDWDHEDDFLRSPLATDYGLVSVWSGRPHWFLHRMGQGETIGDAARLAQNNSGLYETQINSAANRIHIALMGDPTLRLHPVVPAANLNGAVSGTTASLSWSASTDSAIVGYHIYRRDSATSAFARLTASPISATTYSDGGATTGATYMVRAVKLESTPSGSYYNASQGVFYTAGSTSTAPAPSDSTAPVIALSSPASGAIVSGALAVSATATDNVGVTGVQFKLDGANLGAEVTAAPFTTNWSSTGTTDGTHTLSAVARDAAGNMTSAANVSVTVSNAVAGSGGSTTTTSSSTPSTTTSGSTSSTTSTTTTTNGGDATLWFDDALPDGAGASTNGDTWNWVNSAPAPYSGTVAHRSDLKAGLHEHSFNWAAPFVINAGEVLFTYVYLDPANPPSEIMLSWASANWEHRAYWGSNDINYGTDRTASRAYMGPLPETGKWVRLEVPASAVALEGASVIGMGFSLFNGTATWDCTGKALAAAPVLATLPTVSVTATDSYAVIGSATDNAQLTFTRTGSTAGDLIVNYTLGGSAVKWTDYRRVEGDMPVAITIPAGSASATMTIVAVANVTNANPETAVFNLSPDPAYAVGTAAGATITLGATPATAPAPTASTPTTSTTSSAITDSTTGDTTWFDDALPAGAGGGASGGDAWTWTASNPTPFSGTVAHQTNIRKGLHEHYFNWATDRLAVAAGNKLFVYVYLDPANLPSEIMVSWCSDNWEHRAYWGEDRINYGKRGTAGRYNAGALPTAGQWVRLEVPASAVGLEGASLQGMCFTLYDGQATWDKTGATSGTTTSTTTSGTTSGSGGTTTATDFAWVDDALPAGAGPGSTGGDSWNWITTSPAPFSGTSAHQSSIAAGLHEHFFNWASTTMSVATGETLYTYVYLDPANPTSEIMLSWNSGNWEHRAYWGADKINYGTPGTASRYYAGPLPTAGQWVRLEVPASAVALEGGTVEGMCFSTYDGRVTYDKAGKGASAGSGTVAGGTTSGSTTTTTTASTVTVTATDATALIGSTTDTALLTFARAGSTAGSLVVNYTLGGTAVKWTDYRRPEGDMPVAITIPDGASSATMAILGIANTNNANPETAVFTLSPDAAYTVGSSNSATLTIASSGTSSSGGTTTSSGGTTSTTTTPTPPPPTTTTTSPTPVVNSAAENAAIRLPQVGDNQLTILSPTMLELRRITTKQSDPATVTDWNFVSNGVLTPPAATEFSVLVNGQSVAVKSVGFRRRAAYAPLEVRDLRIDNALILELATTVPEAATVEVKNPSNALWPSAMVFKSTSDPLRFNPALHVNQEGYVPSFTKKAMIGYYLGSLGEMDVSAGAGFKIVTASTGVTVMTGTLTSRREAGYAYTPLPYQKVLEADFSTLTTPGEYQLVVPGLGASLPFLVNEGVAMAFTRTYALGLYHQRCGVANAMPFTRHIHDACHTLPAEVPSPDTSYTFTWTTIASKNADCKSDPRHTAPQLKDEASQLYPFVNKGLVDVSLGHHDAGDYSKYTINVAQLTHLLTFAADSIGGAAALDNLGLPESGDGVSDILQEAKQEADYLAKLQDADGGFYFIVYPKTREYESDVLPDHGDQQVVWPKNTSATAAAVGALAQIASSPMFKQKYPTQAAAYLSKAKLGWQFLVNAIAKYGKDGSYQKITFYGNNYLHDDELAWAAASLFAATGESQYSQKLMEWFPDPSDSNTFRWGWWRMSESWGNAIRMYAFAARSGRLAASQLDSTYLAKCEEQIKLAGDDALKWSNESAYGTAFPEATRHVMAAGWYFSLDQASDMAVAYQLNPKPEYVTALVGNMNYEAGTNPVNVTYLTGLGLKRQREVVNQYAKNDRRALAPAGIPLGNVQDGPESLWYYPNSELRNLSFPADVSSGTSIFPFYDRWTDTWNVTTEFITVNQARSLISSAVLANLTAAKSTPWKPATTVKILAPTTVAPVGSPLTLSFDATGLDLTNTRVVWEARDQQPDYGSTYTITPKNAGTQWVEVEVTWPDGRRLVGSTTFQANSAVITWVDDDVPSGASISAVSDAWNWVTSGPAPTSGTRAHQTAAGTGLREHAFNYASAALPVGVGDTMFAWVYLDPAALPEEIMLHWNDGTWEHRAYWGVDKIQYGTANTASRYNMGPLPAGGGWVKLQVPANTVALEGRNVVGMCFSTYGGGKVTWDAAGRTSPVQ